LSIPKNVYPRAIKDVALLYLDEIRSEAAKKTVLDAVAETKVLDLLNALNLGANVSNVARKWIVSNVSGWST